MIYKDYNNFYIIPTIRFYYDKYFDGALSFLHLEIVWLKWSIGIKLKDK